MSSVLWLIPALPLAASVIIGIFGPKMIKGQCHVVSAGAIVLSCILSVVAFFGVTSTPDKTPLVTTCYTWFDTLDIKVDISFRLDSLNAIMLMTVTFVGALIAIYAGGYMHGDEGYARFFMALSLFIFSMNGLVLADNFILLYAFWEGVGLCSYLLVGFWFQKPAAAAAARKAFLVTRIGDVGLLLGILLIWSYCGSVDYQTVFDWAGNSTGADRWVITTACLLLFCGAAGKSAQFPLHVWLPDAMEGPTPVSALIHAATMVTAGVYLVARCTPLFVFAPEAQLVVAVSGGITMLFAALIALTQNDLKRVLAYSTLSQLGYMFLALGCALSLDYADKRQLSSLTNFAVVAAMFHLFTHAFFKALLFLSAGSVMHAMGGVIDMRKFSGLRYAMPTTHWTFLAGALALAAVPLMSGFWSKDEILASSLGAALAENNQSQPIYAALFIAAMITAGLTAFYTFRAYFLTFWGELKIPHEAGHHAHESPPLMTLPLKVLAVGAITVGFLNAGLVGLHWFSHVVEPLPYAKHVVEPLTSAKAAHAEEAIPIGTQWLVMLSGTAFGLGGIGLAYWMYVVKPGVATRLAGSIQSAYQLSLNKFYVDELYSFFIVKPAKMLASLSSVLDRFLVDGLVDLIGQLPGVIGGLFRPIQNGLTQFYALAMALGVAVFLTALAWRFAW